MFHFEVSMAKRRNPKKEKALRNEAYARKFRKRSTARHSQRMTTTGNNTETKTTTSSTAAADQMTNA